MPCAPESIDRYRKRETETERERERKPVSRKETESRKKIVFLFSFPKVTKYEVTNAYFSFAINYRLLHNLHVFFLLQVIIAFFFLQVTIAFFSPLSGPYVEVNQIYLFHWSGRKRKHICLAATSGNQYSKSILYLYIYI